MAIKITGPIGAGGGGVSGVSSVNGATGVVNLYADNATLNLAGDGLTVSGAGATSTLTVDDASTTAAGKVELADNTEAAAASATDRALTPSNIPSIETGDLNNTAGFISGITGESLNDLSDVSYTAGAGIDNYVLTYDHSTTSWGAEAAPTAAAASTTVAGIVELADNTEAAAASATDRALTPANIPSIETGDLNNTAGFIADITGESLNDLSDVSYTAGAGIDNYVLTYDHSTTSWGAEAAPTAGAASTTTAGIVELADNTEAAAASATDRALTPANIPSIETGDLNNTAGFISNLVSDLSPQLGNNLDVQARIIETSTANGSIGLEPDGTGSVVARGTGAGNTPGTITLNCEENSHGVALQSPPHSAAASYTLKLPTGVGTSGQLLTTDGNTPAQLSWATVSGGEGRPVVYSVSTSTTIGADTSISASELERIYVVDTTSAVTMTLPQITGNVGNGYKLNIKRDGANTCTITPNAADNIDGGTDGASITLDVDKASFTLVCDGTNWQII
jgi:hypothetical protein